MFRSCFSGVLLLVLVSVNLSLAQGTKWQDADSSGAVTYAAPMPKFPGGQAEYLRFLKKNLKYPPAEYWKGIHGKVLIQFVVDTNGVLLSPHVVKGIPEGEALNQEALRVVSKMPDWEPGLREGLPVKVRMNLPIAFNLSDEIPVTSSVPPAFQGGPEAMQLFLKNNLVYPRVAKRRKIEGTAIVKVIIDKNGAILRPQPVSKIGSGIEDEALRLVQAMPAWVPGSNDGHIVEKEVLIRVEFKLTEEK
ncbi:MAG TPA: energy transducer TonB [Bacteroidia bacterium]|nr:energy transducer TonB [Bacteroidia bacterium]